MKNCKVDLCRKIELITEVKNIFSSLDVTLEYIKVKYNTLINSDIILREFTLVARNRQYKLTSLCLKPLTSILKAMGRVSTNRRQFPIFTPSKTSEKVDTFSTLF